MTNSRKELNIKANPKNKEHAYAMQLEDSVKVLKACSYNKESFKSQLKTIQGFIDIYNETEK